MDGRSAGHGVVVSTRHVQSKVPHVTVYFWAVMVMVATVGQAGAYFLTVRVHLAPVIATAAIGGLLGWALLLQFTARRYTPWRFWTAAALTNIAATLVTLDLVSGAGFPVIKTAIGFAVLLAATLVVWRLSEGTCSIESIVTRRREVFYWVSMALAFVCGTAIGDALAWRIGLGFGHTAGLVAIGIAAIAIGQRGHLLNLALAFWGACVLTQPIGASLRDWLSLSPQKGGLGLGALHPSAAILIGFAALVLCFARTGLDRPRLTDDEFIRTAPR